MQILNEQDIINVMNGAALLAAGGGGCFDDGMILLESFKKNHPDKPIVVRLVDSSEMEDDTYAAVVAGMGAPTEGAGKDFTPCAVDAFAEVQRMAAEMGKGVHYTMPVEMGAFNTFVPMLISLMTGLPTLDADAAGRAVPGLDTLLSHINGGATSPLAMADDNGNITHIRCADPHDAVMAQNIASPIARAFHSNAGIAGWIMGRDEIQARIPTGTISLAKAIGEVIQQARAFATDFKDGFDVGSYVIGEEEGCYKILFQNENLLLYQLAAGGEERLLMTAPDIITLYNAQNGDPITNEDLFLHREAGDLDTLQVALGVIRVDQKWWRRPENTEAAWRPYFDVLGYGDEVVRFSQLGVRSAE